jgi:hypothetical protein
MDQSSNTPRITSRGILGMIYYEIERYLGLEWVNDLAMTVTSDQEVEEIAMLGMPPGWREKMGGVLPKRLREYTMSLRNRDYDSALAIPEKWLRRDKTPQVRMRIRDHVKALVDHDVDMLSQFIAAGTGSTLGTAIDNQYFFDTDHVWGDSGAYKNLLTATEVPELDVGTPTKPTPEEVALAVFGMITYMMSYKDDTGRLMNATATKFRVMTGLKLAARFADAFSNRMVSTGTGTVENPLRAIVKISDQIKIDLSINPLLSWTDKFSVWRTDVGFKPLIRMVERPPVASVLGESSDHYKKEDELLYIFKKSGYWGYGAPQYAALGTFS